MQRTEGRRTVGTFRNRTLEMLMGARNLEVRGLVQHAVVHATSAAAGGHARFPILPEGEERGKERTEQDCQQEDRNYAPHCGH